MTTAIQRIENGLKANNGNRMPMPPKNRSGRPRAATSIPALQATLGGVMEAASILDILKAKVAKAMAEYDGEKLRLNQSFPKEVREAPVFTQSFSKERREKFKDVWASIEGDWTPTMEALRFGFDVAELSKALLTDPRTVLTNSVGLGTARRAYISVEVASMGRAAKERMARRAIALVESDITSALDIAAVLLADNDELEPKDRYLASEFATEFVDSEVDLAVNLIAAIQNVAMWGRTDGKALSEENRPLTANERISVAMQYGERAQNGDENEGGLAELGNLKPIAMAINSSGNLVPASMN